MKIPVHLMIAGTALFFSAFALAQVPVAYPAKGQDKDQQASDDTACKAWAQENTGVDPAAPVAAPAPAAAPAPTGPQGHRLRGAARGAAAGAVAGEIIDGDSSDGAKKGAAVGVLAGGSRARRSQAAQQQQAQANQAQAQAQAEQAHAQANATYGQAYGACMEGRGYTVN